MELLCIFPYTISLRRNLTNVIARSSKESRIGSMEEGSKNEGGEEEAQRKTLHIHSYILTAAGNLRDHEIERVYFNAREGVQAGAV